MPELIEAVAAGQVAVSAASRIATLPAPQQQEVLAGIQRGVKLGSAQPLSPENVRKLMQAREHYEGNKPSGRADWEQ